MRDMYIGATAVFDTANLRASLGEKFAELEKEKGVRVRDRDTFVSYQRGETEDTLLLPELVKQIRPHYYTTSVRVEKPWIGVRAVAGSGKVLDPNYRNDERGTMGFFVRGGVTLYTATTRGYVEIEYVSLTPAEEGQLKIKRNRFLQLEDLPLQAAVPEEFIEEQVAEAIKDVPHAFTQHVLKAFEQARERNRAYRQANPEERSGKTAMTVALEKATKVKETAAEKPGAEEIQTGKDQRGGKQTRQSKARTKSEKTPNTKRVRKAELAEKEADAELEENL